MGVLAGGEFEAARTPTHPPDLSCRCSLVARVGTLLTAIQQRMNQPSNGCRKELGLMRGAIRGGEKLRDLLQQAANSEVGRLHSCSSAPHWHRSRHALALRARSTHLAPALVCADLQVRCAVTPDEVMKQLMEGHAGTR